MSTLLAAIADLSNYLWKQPLVRICAAIVAVLWFIELLLVRKKRS